MTPERVCPICQYFFAPNSEKQIYCSQECYRERACLNGESYGQRIEDGMRMRSDDFGQQPKDNFNLTTGDRRLYPYPPKEPACWAIEGIEDEEVFDDLPPYRG